MWTKVRMPEDATRRGDVRATATQLLTPGEKLVPEKFVAFTPIGSAMMKRLKSASHQ